MGNFRKSVNFFSAAGCEAAQNNILKKLDFPPCFLYSIGGKCHGQSLSTDLFSFISWLLHNRNAFFTQTCETVNKSSKSIDCCIGSHIRRSHADPRSGAGLFRCLTLRRLRPVIFLFFGVRRKERTCCAEIHLCRRRRQSLVTSD